MEGFADGDGGVGAEEGLGVGCWLLVVGWVLRGTGCLRWPGSGVGLWVLVLVGVW